VGKSETQRREEKVSLRQERGITMVPGEGDEEARPGNSIA